MKIKALGWHVVLKPVKVEKKVGDIAIIDKIDKNNRYLLGEVLSAPKDSPLKEGDKLYYDRTATHPIDHNGTLYQVIKLQDIIGVLEE